ncbi:putative toxin-antitoxin system antitoxin component, TIGR02293 family [Cnuella takakiae]|uniref:Putative toxin-antitoxin system antitoxin component, TIGR02293 family n=2 Tax=Cnuella takakiae TaxID=1302690 RepID=A0A1M4V2V2_9BACT|nr:putative toxin-antitoxin system antitoxin component, TIGR02293 family [Cnuella takakiae]
MGKKQDREVAIALPKKTDSMAQTAAADDTGRPVHEWTGMEKISKVRQGMTRKDLEDVKESFGLDYETLAKVLSVAKATLFNKKGAEKFNPSLSEKIFVLADLYSYGLSVFGEKERFNSWLEKENRALGYARPLELLDTMIGVDEVKNMIGRIEHGIYA